MAGIMTTRNKEFWALDWLRFCLALYIVLFHTLKDNYLEIAKSAFKSLLDLGNLATTIFFVLSGFLLTHVYVLNNERRQLNIRAFLVARFSTLYPLHVVGILLALPAFFLAIHAYGGIRVPIDPSGVPLRTLSMAETALSVIMSLTLLNAWNPLYLTLNFPSWSLSALALFYCIFPFAAPRLCRTKSPKLYLILLGILFVIPGIIADLMHRADLITDGILHRNPLIRLPLFLAGILLCAEYKRRKRAAHGCFRTQVLLITVALATVVAGAYCESRVHNLHFIRNGLYFPGALALVWLFAAAKPNANEKLNIIGARLGGASLSIFLLHAPLFDFFLKAEKITMALINKPYAGNFSSMVLEARALEANVFLYPLYLALLILTSLFIHEQFVLPTQKYLRKRLMPSVTNVTSKKPHPTTNTEVSCKKECLVPAAEMADESINSRTPILQ
jgi:peptidoglycan/LPS O-acetylase OafA/YrhL